MALRAETVPVRVLLIHGAAAAAEHLEALLRARLPTNSNVEMMTAATGEDALDLAAETPIDLAISDLVLPWPGISGPYTLIRLREHFPNVRTILISRHPSLQKLTRRVADAYVVDHREKQDVLLSRLDEAVWSLLTGSSAKPVHPARRDRDNDRTSRPGRTRPGASPGA